MPRLDRLVSDRSDLSRSLARQAIRRGRVFVQGERCKSPSQNVSEDSAITLDARALDVPPLAVAFHKPADVQCTVGDPRGRENLEDLVGELLTLGLHPVGRLDADTDGLLLLSRDGALTQRLLHPRHAVPKHYRATVEGEPGDALRQALTEGVKTAHGVHTAEVILIEDDVVELTVTEGKNRMVRRMLHNAGHSVVTLRRLAVGPITLGDLPSGEWRTLTEQELHALRALA